MKKVLIIFLGLTLIFSVAYFLLKTSPFDLENILKSRPSKKEYLYDYARILEEVEEYSNRYLKGIRERYFIDAIVVSVPSLEGKGSIEDLAVKLLNNWKIGGDYEGRGVLLLLADREKQVKIEVSYELEDVFTDMFCGYIEDMQLRPYFLSGRPGTGLLAVMEEIENRAQIKHQGEYTTDYIKEIDSQLLSGGAGAKRDLSKFQKEEVEDAVFQYPAGKTPGEAWERMIQSWRDKARDPKLGIYTEITKLTYRDYQNLTDSYYEKNVRTYANKPYEVIRKGDYAVIFFGNKEGWDNSPFLFCKTPEGWKYDIVHQRKYVRMGPSPYWGIERANYPYIDLLTRSPYMMGQDIPLEGEDIYRVEDDKRLAEKIRRLEAEYKNNPDDFNVALELGRLYTVASMGPKHISILKKARALNPDNPLPSKYLAIAYVDTTYQYKAAIKEMKEYIKREPRDIFGHNFQGYLYFCIERYEEAVKEFKKAIQLGPDNSYAYCKLSRSYGQMYLNASKLNPRRNTYKTLAIEMLSKAQNTTSPDYRRIGWLQYWLKKKGILPGKNNDT